MDSSHLNQKHVKNANGLQESVHKRCSKYPSFARTHDWRRFLHWSTAVSIITCRYSDHTAIEHSPFPQYLKVSCTGSRLRSELTSSLHGAAPSYLADELCLLADLSPRRRLRSAPSSSLVVRRTRLSTIGDRNFPVAAAHVWNGLQQHVTSASSLSTFRRRLKTRLFQRCFPWLFVSCLSSDFCHFRTR